MLTPEADTLVHITHMQYHGEGEDCLWRVLDMWCPGCDCLHRVNLPANPGERVMPGKPTWEWDGNLELPTITPSILAYNSVHLCEHTLFECPAESGGECDQVGHMLGYRLPDGSVVAPKVTEAQPVDGVRIRVHRSPCDRDPAYGHCHSFVAKGMWQFLGDSAHKLAGQTVPMVPLPGWYLRD